MQFDSCQSSHRFTTLAHSCNSPGGILAIFLKIFFAASKSLVLKSFSSGAREEIEKNVTSKNPLSCG
jgi:hypothetical protein